MVLYDIKYISLTHTEDSGEQHDVIFNNVKFKTWKETPVKKKGKIIGRRLKLDVTTELKDLDIISREIPYEQVLVKKYLKQPKNQDKVYKELYNALLKYADSLSNECETYRQIDINNKTIIDNNNKLIELYKSQIPEPKTQTYELSVFLTIVIMIVLSAIGMGAIIT